MVTHEEEVARYAKRVIRLRDGRSVSDSRETNTVSFLKTNEIPFVSGETPFQKIVFGSTIFFKECREWFIQSIRALAANKIRTALSMCGILIGVAAVIAMLAIGKGAQMAIQERLSALGSNLLVVMPGSQRVHGVALEAGTVTRFTRQDAEDIRTQIQGVKRVVPNVNGTVRIAFQNKNHSTRLLGTTTDYAFTRSAQPTFGRFFSQEEDTARHKVALIGMSVAKALFIEEGRATISPIGETIQINKIAFQVIGILPEKGASGWRDEDDVIVIPFHTAMSRVLGKDYVDTIEVEVISQDMMPEVESRIQELIIRNHRLPPVKHDSFQIRNLAQIQETLAFTNKIMSLLLSTIAAISLLVGGIGIMNIMLVSVTERTREIGLRKAIGARPRDIQLQFLMEAVLVSLTGGLFGIFLGWAAASSLSFFAGWAVSFSLSAVLLAFCFSVTIGIVFGFWPAQKAARLHPIDALRYE